MCVPSGRSFIVKLGIRSLLMGYHVLFNSVHGSSSRVPPPNSLSLMSRRGRNLTPDTVSWESRPLLMNCMRKTVELISLIKITFIKFKYKMLINNAEFYQLWFHYILFAKIILILSKYPISRCLIVFGNWICYLFTIITEQS